jgi:hypothetical protein
MGLLRLMWSQMNSPFLLKWFAPDNGVNANFFFECIFDFYNEEELSVTKNSGGVKLVLSKMVLNLTFLHLECICLNFFSLQVYEYAISNKCPLHVLHRLET